MFDLTLQVLYQFREVLFLLLIFGIIYLIRSRFVILSHWHHTYDGSQFSTLEFYDAAEKAISERKLPGVSLKRTTHKNRIFFSGDREYLRVHRLGIAFDICAAPNGTGMYISWWHHENYSNFERFVLMKIPVLNWVYRSQTLHQYDLEQMFEDVVHACVLETADAMVGVKGSTLSEAERSIISSARRFNN
jgi:hypothetical protein